MNTLKYNYLLTTLHIFIKYKFKMYTDFIFSIIQKTDTNYKL